MSLRQIVVVVIVAVGVVGVVAAAPAAAHLPGEVARTACPGCPSPVPCSGEGCFTPAPDVRWQIQLQGVANACDTGGVDTDVAGPPFGGGPDVTPDLFAIDLYDMSVGCGDIPASRLNRKAVGALHAAGIPAIAYIDAGTWERWRPDQHRFVVFDRRCGGCLLGDALGAFPDERWFNIGGRHGQRAFLLRMMGRRLDKAVRAGFDGVYFDNQDEYLNVTGFALTGHDQIGYLTRLLNMAHRRGLDAGPNNDILQTRRFAPYADYMLNEQCFQYRECYRMNAMLAAGKPVFEIEYRSSEMDAYCPIANRRGIDTIGKGPSLYDLPWHPCR